MGRASVEWKWTSASSIIELTELVMRTGLRPGQLFVSDDLDSWLAKADWQRSGTPDLAITLTEVVREAVFALGAGPAAEATQGLFGATADSRGQPLKRRRQIAADALDLAVSTFRKYYEDPLVLDVAFQIYANQRQHGD